MKQILGEPIGVKRISSYSIAVSGDKGSPNTTVLKALASQPENYWSLSDEELTNKKLLEIAQPASGESPVIFFVIDQSGSLKSKSSIIERAVEKTIRELFEKTDHLVKIPGGRATIGSPPTESGRDEDEPLFHPVVESFYLSPYLFTQREYESVWGPGSNPSAVQGPDLPVTNISWHRAVETLNKLSEQKGFTPVYTITRDGGNIVVEWDTSADGYRLPTEIEWEFACRAGTTSPFYTGTSINKQQANIKGTAPTAVGKYPPNGLGLYDIIGNVKEFCFDIFGRYPSDEGDVFEAVGVERVNRGGSFANWDDATLRSAYRSYDDPNTTSSILGFRVTRNFVE